MKRIIVFFAVVVQMLLLPCCVEKQGYYSSGEESIIALICDITWTGGKKSMKMVALGNLFGILIKMGHIHELM